MEKVIFEMKKIIIYARSSNDDPKVPEYRINQIRNHLDSKRSFRGYGEIENPFTDSQDYDNPMDREEITEKLIPFLKKHHQKIDLLIVYSFAHISGSKEGLSLFYDVLRPLKIKIYSTEQGKYFQDPLKKTHTQYPKHYSLAKMALPEIRQIDNLLLRSIKKSSHVGIDWRKRAWKAAISSAFEEYTFKYLQKEYFDSELFEAMDSHNRKKELYCRLLNNIFKDKKLKELDKQRIIYPMVIKIQKLLPTTKLIT